MTPPRPASLRVLVTGGAGFVGSHVVTELGTAGHEVRVLDDLSTSPPPAARDVAARDGAGGRPELVVGRLDDAALVERCLDGVDAVCHQAAKVGLGDGVDDLPDYVARNDLGTAVLLREMARAGVGRLVLASSMVVYGEGGYSCPGHGRVRPGPRARADLAAGRFEPRCPSCGAALSWREVGEDSPVDPRNGYATTKVAQEHLAATWARATGGRATALRYHNVYGPRLPRDTPYAGVAALFRSALARGQPPRVFEDGAQLRDFVHVRDVARANRIALEADGAGHLSTRHAGHLSTYNIASGTPTTVGQLAAALAEALGGPTPVVTGEFRLGDVRHIVASPRRAREQLGFVAEVPLAEGMAGFAVEDEPAG